MRTKEVVIADIAKKYKNPIAELVQVACRYESTVNLVEGDHCINAKSIMGIMAFRPAQGKRIMITAEGSDEETALSAMEQYLLCTD